jgi:hypothetical protein
MFGLVLRQRGLLSRLTGPPLIPSQKWLLASQGTVICGHLIGTNLHRNLIEISLYGFPNLAEWEIYQNWLQIT